MKLNLTTLPRNFHTRRVSIQLQLLCDTPIARITGCVLKMYILKMYIYVMYLLHL